MATKSTSSVHTNYQTALSRTHQQTFPQPALPSRARSLRRSTATMSSSLLSSRVITFGSPLITRGLRNTLGAGVTRPEQKFRRFSTSTTASMDSANEEYTHIIVGGGTAGSVLANRLSASEKNRVLVLEAGKPDNENLLVRIPVAILKLFKSDLDWDYATSGEKAASNRQIYICRGKVLGGSSCINVMLYNRGSAADYDHWAEVTGDAGWGADSMLQYFKMAQNNLSEENSGEGKWHSKGGPYAVSDVPYQNEMSRAFLEAAQQAGYPANSDFNDWSRPQEGVGRYQVNQNAGVRVNAASAYLDPVRDRANLHVSTSVTASKVLMEGDTACGVQYVDETGATQEAKLKAGGDVVVSLGAVSSPQLLMLSGIGPKEHLEEMGIECKVDLAGVGSNLQDHAAVLVSHNAQGKPAAKGVSHSSQLRIPSTTLSNPLKVLQWLVSKSGPLTSPGCDHGGFIKSAPGIAEPDLQLRFLATKTITPDGMSTISKQYAAEANHPDGTTIQVITARPESRGSVRLSSRDPRDKPVLNGGYLENPADVASLVKGLRKAREIYAQAALGPYRGDEEFPGPEAATDAELEQYVRDTVHSANAVVGTCKMGVEGDAMAVVDPALRVHGVKGLRVVDASVMPKLPGGQTASSTIAIAEKAAELIQNPVEEATPAGSLAGAAA